MKVATDLQQLVDVVAEPGPQALLLLFPPDSQPVGSDADLPAYLLELLAGVRTGPRTGMGPDCLSGRRPRNAQGRRRTRRLSKGARGSFLLVVEATRQ